MLLGRGVERARIDALLEAARRGESGVLVLRGEAGIGKSSLIRYAVESATAMRVLAGRGIEAEAEIAYSGLDELLRPVLERLIDLAAAQATAVRSALALDAAGPIDPLALRAGVLSLLAAVADDTPLLIAVDDLQWVDAASAHALLFAARRLRGERIAVVAAVRDGVGATVDFHVPELRLDGLTTDDAIELLAEHSVAPAAARRLRDAVAGNPLALVELPALLTEEQREGAVPLPDPLPVGESIARAFAARVEALPAGARRALVVAAATDSPDLDPVLQAVAAIGIGDDALERAEQSGLISVWTGTFEFRHPLLRSAVYSAAAADERRRAHRALANALRGPRDADRRAWHLAEAAVGPDDAVAAALDDSADRAARRGGYTAAARALARAAELTSEPEHAAQRYVDAARTAELAGAFAHARELLAEARLSTDEPLVLADVDEVAALIGLASGALEWLERLRRTAEDVAPLDPSRAVRMLTEVAAWAMDARHHDQARAAALRARELALASGIDTDVRIAAVLGVLGEGDSATFDLELATKMSRDPRLATVALWAVANSDYDPQQVAATLAVIENVIERARELGAARVLPEALLEKAATLYFAAGDWAGAYAAMLEAVDLARLTGQPTRVLDGLMRLARLEAFAGREEDCRAHVAEIRDLASRHGIDWHVNYCGVLLGELELGLGNLDEAIFQLESARVSSIAKSRAAADLVEAYARAGRLDDARRGLADVEAVVTGAMVGAAAARLRGFTGPDAELDAHFGEALELYAELAQPLEHARTELMYGERLRRAGRRVDARVHLYEAERRFDRLGATLWADRARAELAATGEPGRRRAGANTNELTPQELQVAVTVAEGATNKEAAARLFLSTKTIEFHLRNIYRKLGVRSRTELARLLAPGAATADAVAAAPLSSFGG